MFDFLYENKQHIFTIFALQFVKSNNVIIKKIYMKIMIFIYSFLFSQTLFCQVNFAKDADYKDFMQTKTLVVLNNNPFSSYNVVIQKAVETLWKITPYEFITPKEFISKKGNKAYSFLILTDAALEHKKTLMQYNILNLILGGKVNTINDMPDLGSIPLSYTNEEEEDYLYKIGGVLQFMQYFVHYNLNNPNKDLLKLLKNIEGNIGNKEIWLLKNEVDDEVNTLEKIKQYYTGSVKFATEEEIADAIARKDANVIFLHKIGNNVKENISWKVLISAENGEAVYFEQHKIDQKHPDAFTAEDFGKLKSR